MRVCVRLLLCLLLCLPALAWAGRTQYRVEYTVSFQPARKQAVVTLKYTPGSGQLRQLRFRMPPARYPDIKGEGQLSRKGDSITWIPPKKGSASLSWTVMVEQEHRGGGYDARITPNYALLRGDALVPPSRVKVSKGADSFVRLRFVLPRGWTNVDTPYLPARDGKAYVVVNPDRNFDRPVGWIVAGQIGTRREYLQDTEIAVAGPKGSDVRRNDMLAFLNTLMPEFRAAFGKLPPKLLVVSDGDPMWRGGLSGPRSLFIHADRPMISENGTSTLVHEFTHVITRIRGAEDDDWIAEGLAEFYSIELLHRSGLISDNRYQKAFDWMAKHGRAVKVLHTNRSSGRRTARAVTFFHELDLLLRQRSGGKYGMDQVTRDLIPLRTVSREELRREVEQRIGPCELFDAPLLQ